MRFLDMEIVRAPDSRLRVKTKPINKITPELVKVARQMINLAASFKDPEGVGLASVQIGRDEAFFVAKIGKTFKIFFNPKIISAGKRTKKFFEGCLSIPDHYGEIKRPTKIVVSYFNESGQEVTKPLNGTSAWIFQHEIDHINGKLFVDCVLKQRSKMFKAMGRDQAGAEIFEEVQLA